MNTRSNVVPDGRMREGRRAAIGLENDSKVYQALQTIGHPVTIAELDKFIEDMVERTIRRSIQRLFKAGHIHVAGKDGSAIMYQPVGTMANSNEARIIPFAGALIDIESFLRMMIDPDNDPFKPRLKIDVLDVDFITWLRRRFIVPIITAGEMGYNDQVERTRTNLQKVQIELAKLAETLDTFIQSPVWYEQYRDRIALQLREITREDPELIELVRAYIQNQE